jgi:phage repressor protein C with HTH and peptisase S24 domain
VRCQPVPAAHPGSPANLSSHLDHRPRRFERHRHGTATAPPLAGGGNGDPSQPQRADEELLTGSTADKVEAAALAKHPGATVVRIETDSDGVYEAHLTTAAGQPVTVEVNKSFAVTGVAQGGPGGTGVPGHKSAQSGTAIGYGT